MRSVPKAVLLACIPLVHVYLFYSWCNELKLKYKIPWLNSTLYSLLFIFPILQAYPIYKLLSLANDSFEKKYPIAPICLSILFLLVLIPPFWPLWIVVWLYTAYETQKLFNENGI